MKMCSRKFFDLAPDFFLLNQNFVLLHSLAIITYTLMTLAVLPTFMTSNIS